MVPGDTDRLIPSATVILVRPAVGSFQVYLLRRSPASGFMAGQYVFPGGIIDADDRDASFWKEKVDLDGEGIQQGIGGSIRTGDALSFGVAAIRETMEEAGVLLASGNDSFHRQLEQIRQRRRVSGLSHGWLREMAQDGNWTLSLSGLRRWSHWITPRGMTRRFDTRFFLAVLPEWQSCDPDHQETVHGLWTTPKEGLQGNLDGKVPLSPPTVVTLHQLLEYLKVEAVMASSATQAWNAAIRPRMVKLDEGAVIIEPWDPAFHRETISIDPDGLDSAVAPVGRSFSRIWIHRGWCRPIISA